ncbi:DUF4262 domain-containing protein [Mariniluteicoccus flavus]
MTTSSSSAHITAWNDQQERRVATIVRHHGCCVQSVHGDEHGSSFSYTVGLFGLSHPELIVFGLDHLSAGGTLNWFFDRIRGGDDLTAGEVVHAPNGGPRFLVEEFPNPKDALYVANHHYRRPRKSSVPAYQLTWDVNGAFPWDAGYPYSASMQPRPGDYVKHPRH